MTDVPDDYGELPDAALVELADALFCLYDAEERGSVGRVESSRPDGDASRLPDDRVG